MESTMAPISLLLICSSFLFQPIVAAKLNAPKVLLPFYSQVITNFTLQVEYSPEETQIANCYQWYWYHQFFCRHFFCFFFSILPTQVFFRGQNKRPRYNSTRCCNPKLYDERKDRSRSIDYTENLCLGHQAEFLPMTGFSTLVDHEQLESRYPDQGYPTLTIISRQHGWQGVIL